MCLNHINLITILIKWMLSLSASQIKKLKHTEVATCLRFSCCAVTQSCPIFCNPMDGSTPGFTVLHHFPYLTFIESVMPSNHLILCRPLLLLSSIFPSIRVFSNESAHCIRWPKYWSFSFIISPSNKHPGLVSFRIDWLDLLAVQGTLKSLLQHQFKSINSPELSFLHRPTLTSIHDQWKNHSLD